VEAAHPAESVGVVTALDDKQREDLDASLTVLSDGAAKWARTALADRAKLLGAVRRSMIATAQEWAETAAAIKGLPRSSPLIGEEWLSGPYPTLAGVGMLARSVGALAAGVSPLAAAEFGAAPGGRVTVRVLPTNKRVRLLLHGCSAEVWMAPGRTVDDVRASAGLGELTPTVSGGVGLVLGAGNITSIAPLDALYEIVANNRAVLLKLNPVLAKMKPVLDQALSPLIEFGVLRIVQGAGDVGGYLTQHERVSNVHITGSAATHDAIVWGPGEAGEGRRAAHAPLLLKPITSELGGVSPIIIVPGAWTRRDLRYQAEHVATQRLHNGGYNCIAGQVVILSSDWAQKEVFLAELRRAIDSAPSRPAWYPGSDSRVAAASVAYPNSEHLGDNGERLLITVKAEDDAVKLMTTEYFSPVLGVVEVSGGGQTFLDHAVTVANDDLTGTLGANVIIAPKTETQLGAGFLNSMAKLRYGTIGINAWTGLGFLTSAVPWGAFPGARIDNVESGIGIVHNAMLIDRPERAVVRGPFRPFPRSFIHGQRTLLPRPPWFVQARSAAATGKRMTEYVSGPTWRKVFAVLRSELRA
jgi:aldehyde dehydrogenase (NAD(P)+)